MTGKLPLENTLMYRRRRFGANTRSDEKISNHAWPSFEYMAIKGPSNMLFVCRQQQSFQIQMLRDDVLYR